MLEERGACISVCKSVGINIYPPHFQVAVQGQGGCYSRQLSQDSSLHALRSLLYFPRTQLLHMCVAGVACWIRFAEATLGGRCNAFPPTLEGVLAWSHTFQCVGTFCNYSGHLRSVCLALDVGMPSASDPAIRRAKVAIVKRMLFTPRPRMFLERSTVRNLVLAVDRQLETLPFAMLWLAAYCFLLRVPSEALSMCRGGDDSAATQGMQSVLSLEKGGIVTLKLRSRKNKPGGSTLRRSCSCSACDRTCPLHTLWHGFFEQMPTGSQPWAAFSADAVRCHLRRSLGALQVRLVSTVLQGISFALALRFLILSVSAPTTFGGDMPRLIPFGSHAMHPPHVVALSGSTEGRCVIACGPGCRRVEKQGAWPYPCSLWHEGPHLQAVLSYLDASELEHDAVLEAAMHSDNEDWID